MNEIITLISNIGFPITAAIFLFLQLNKSNEQHSQDMKAITEALNNNTLAITKLTERIIKEDKHNA